MKNAIYICAHLNKKLMKQLILFILPVLMIACKGVEQHRANIEELSADWETTTKEITDFQAQVSNDFTQYNQALAAIHPDDATRAAMTPDQVTAWEASQKPATDALNAYPPFQKKISDFMTTWTEKSEEVTALKDGLASGKIEGDVDARIADLRAMITTANENLTSWKAEYATIKGNVDSAFSGLRQGTMGTSTTN